MVGKSMRGNAATGSSRNPAMPSTTSDSIISTVMTGRRMHSSESDILLSCHRLLDGNKRAVGEQQLPVGHDIVAFIDAVGDDRHALDAAPHCHRLCMGALVAIHGIDI